MTLGYAATMATGLGSPLDGLEPSRRLCQWIFREEADAALTARVWEA